MHKLGEYAERGLGGPRDIDQALDWYRKAMDKGNAEARAAYLRLTMPPPPEPDDEE